MPNRDTPILRLLIAEDSLNEAERFVSVLRNAGHAVRPHRIEDVEDLRQALSEQPADLVLATDGAARLDPATAAQTVADLEKDVPVVAVLQGADENRVASLMESGVRDVVPKGRDRQLDLVVRRELAALADRRALRRAEQRLRELERRNRTFLDSARDAVAYTVDGMHVYANRAYLDLFGYTEFEEIEGLPLLDLIAPRDHEAMKAVLRARAGEETKGQITIHGRRADGEELSLELSYAPATVDGEPCLQIVIREPRRGDTLRAQLAELERRDPVTGLLRRGPFLEQVEEAARRVIEGAPAPALLCIALDGAERVAREAGIDAIDTVLAHLAELLQRRFADGTEMARLTDTDLAALVPVSGPEEAEVLAEAARAAVADTVVELDGRGLAVRVSIGIALVSERAASAREVLMRAAEAVRTAQDEGGDRVVRHHPPAPGGDEGPAWVERMRAALAAGALRLLYQPISHLHGPPHPYYEAFVRLTDEDEEVAAARFMATVDEEPVAVELDRWVAREAIARLAAEQRAGRATSFFLNLSVASLLDEDHLPWLAGEIRAARLEPGRIVLEIPEPVVVSHLAAVRRLAAAVKAAGCRLAVSRFGSGLGSLSILDQVPSHFVKIDPSFLHELDGGGREVIARIVEKARSLEVLTVAEQVEDATALTVLWECGVDYIQGRFLQEPAETLAYDFGDGEAGP